MRHLQDYKLFESKDIIDSKNELAMICLRHLHEKVLFPELLEMTEEVWFTVMYAREPTTNAREIKSQMKDPWPFDRDINSNLLAKVYAIKKTEDNYRYWFSRKYGMLYNKFYNGNEKEFSNTYGYYRFSDIDAYNNGKLKTIGFSDIEIDMLNYLVMGKTPKRFAPKWKTIK